MSHIVSEVELDGKALVVERLDNGLYNVVHGGVIRHPGLTAENAVGAMAHYIHNLSYLLDKARAELDRKR
jgi:hypothetical protein